MLLNYNSITLESFDLTKSTETDDLYDDIIFYLSIILLSSSLLGKNLLLFISDFFGIYLKNSDNPFILMYKSYCDIKIKKKNCNRKKKNYQA